MLSEDFTVQYNQCKQCHGQSAMEVQSYVEGGHQWAEYWRMVLLRIQPCPQRGLALAVFLFAWMLCFTLDSLMMWLRIGALSCMVSNGPGDWDQSHEPSINQSCLCNGAPTRFYYTLNTEAQVSFLTGNTLCVLLYIGTRKVTHPDTMGRDSRSPALVLPQICPALFFLWLILILSSY